MFARIAIVSCISAVDIYFVSKIYCIDRSLFTSNVVLVLHYDAIAVFIISVIIVCLNIRL